MDEPLTLFQRIYSWENLLEAYHKAGKGKWYDNEVADFTANLEENLIGIQNDLIWHTYRVSRYNEFCIYEPKKRLVMAISFRDKVVQWAIYNVIGPIIDSQFIFHSYGGRKGKGPLAASDRLLWWVQKVSRSPREWYYLKLDVAKYYYHVDHGVLMKILAKKFKGEDDFLWLMQTIIECDHTPFGLPREIQSSSLYRRNRIYGTGMPIGSLTSLIFANLCLNELDQFVKHTLKVHHFIRYMDDMVLLYPDKKELNRILHKIEDFMDTELHLDLNHKTTINKVKNGITFVGYRIYPSGRKLNPPSVKRMKVRIRHIVKLYGAGEINFETVDRTMQSYFGHMKHFKSYGLRRWLEDHITFKRNGDQEHGDD